MCLLHIGLYLEVNQPDTVAYRRELGVDRGQLAGHHLPAMPFGRWSQCRRDRNRYRPAPTPGRVGEGGKEARGTRIVMMPRAVRAGAAAAEIQQPQ